MESQRRLQEEAVVRVNPIIRAAKRNDLTELTDLYKHLHDDDAVDEETVNAVFTSILDSEKTVVVVAEIDESVVGTCHLTLVRNLTRGGQPWCALENMVVSPESRRKGIGAALMKWSISWADDRGAYKLQLVSADRRVESHRLYERSGMAAAVKGFRRYL